MVLNADKNLGPVIIEREEYIKNVLAEHLLDENTYENIEEMKALDIIDETRNGAWKLIFEYAQYLSKEELNYFIKSFKKCYSITPQGKVQPHASSCSAPFHFPFLLITRNETRDIKSTK